jgi:murein DD-endopeptidase MepM/ murein hydrolase activator NlpD
MARATWAWAMGMLFVLGTLLAPGTGSALDRLCLDEAPVCIEAVAEGEALDIVVSNDTPAPYSVRVAFTELDNLKPRSRAPFRAVVPAGHKQVVGTLSWTDPDKRYRFQYEWRAALGSMLARPDDRWRYRIPFGGTSPRFLVQGVGGRFSHTGSERYAFDFAMPWGTPILAARDGLVVRVVDGHISGGPKSRFSDKANHVWILHGDGTIGMYAHLQRGAAVRVGQRVATGDLIGRSGDTGYSSGPHLHFMVWRRRSDLGLESVAIRFDDGIRKGFVPTRGIAYAPACGAANPDCVGERPPAAAEVVPAAPAAAGGGAVRREDGACACPNGAVLHVDLPCRQVCGR